VPENQHPAFVRACLESGFAPKPELAQAAAQLSGSSMYLTRDIVAAQSGAGAQEALGNLDELTDGVWAGLQALTGELPPERQLGGDDREALLHLALLMNFDSMLGTAAPESLARGLGREGGPLRDALYDCRGAESGSLADRQLTMVKSMQSALTSRLSEDGTQRLAAALNPDNIRERDLSLSRQREIFGTEVLEVRGASLAESARRARFAPPAAGVGQSMIQARPAMDAHVATNALISLRDGPADDRDPKLTPEQLAARAAQPLSTLFSKDFRRGGVYVDGRYHHPAPPPVGTQSSEADFIALFPNPRAARLISNLLAQNLPGMAMDAQMNAPADVAQAFVSIYADPELAGGRVIHDFRVDTLDAAAGRYRLSAQLQQIAAPDTAGVDRFMSEVTLDVTLGDPPTVDSAKLDFILHGQEP
jgi:hypothetical protein